MWVSFSERLHLKDVMESGQTIPKAQQISLKTIEIAV